MRVSRFIGSVIVNVALLNVVAWGVKAIDKTPAFQDAAYEICKTHPVGCGLGRASNNFLQTSTNFIDGLLIKGLSGVASGLSFLTCGTSGVLQAKPEVRAPVEIAPVISPVPAFIPADQKKKKGAELSPALG